MPATELQSRPAAVAEPRVSRLSAKVAEQVSETLKEAAEGSKVLLPTMSYRVPAPGVRYYF